MNRRGFLGSILAACAAPAIVRADSLMRIVPREATVLTSVDITSAGSGYICEPELVFASQELTLSLDEFSRKYIAPAVRAVAERQERMLWAMLGVRR